MNKPKIAISACLLGTNCKYNAKNNLNIDLLDNLKEYELVPFCPEDFAFGSPRPTMDLVMIDDTIKAINQMGKDVSYPILKYAKKFFVDNPDIKLYIGKNKSPSCGVKNTKLYDSFKKLISTMEYGLMSQVAIDLSIECFDESFNIFILKSR